MKMKSKILSIIASAAMLVSVASCDNYEPKIVGGGEGKLNTSSLSVEVSNAEKIVNEGSATKKGLSRAVTDLSDYLVIVTDAQGNEVKRWTYATMPELPTFPAGTYNINVLSREEPTSAEWDAPFFKGSTSFTIVADEVTDNVKVVCKLANIRVTVKFTDELVAASAGDIKVTVRSEGEQNLTFTPSETRSGYFAAVDGLETLSVAFQGTVQNTEEKFTKVLTEVAGGQHRIITYGLKSNPNEPPAETGGIALGEEGINVSTDVEEEDLTADVPYEEDVLPDNDRPGQEGDDPNQGGGDDPQPGDDAITFSTSMPHGLDYVYDVNDFVANGYTADLTMSVPNGAKSVVVKIDSDNLDVTDVGLVNEFDLATVSGDLATSISGLGFPIGDQVVNQTTLNFDITQFVGLLANFQGKSNFIITVTDNKGNVATTTLQFNVK